VVHRAEFHRQGFGRAAFLLVVATVDSGRSSPGRQSRQILADEWTFRLSADMYLASDTYRQEEPVDHNVLLDNSSPRVAEPTPELRSLLDEMVTVTRPRARRLRAVPVAASGFGAALALGVAGTAAAAVVMHYTNANVPDSTQTGQFSWTSAQGHACTLRVSVGPRADSDPNYSSSQSAALNAAQGWMNSFDVSRITIPEAERTWLNTMHRTQTGNPNSANGTWSVAELERTYAGDELERYAVMDAATTDLSSYLKASGYALRSLNSGVGTECDE